MLLDQGLERVVVDVDYGADPIWAFRSEGVVGNLDLDAFGLETQLVDALRSWARDWESGVAAVSAGVESSADREQRWRAMGRTLANRLQSALRGHLLVHYAFDADPESPVWDQS
ncbi:hypothetical protein FHX74_001660 [Friedmanniella endophytica]|uniref:Uncharacterized protein n=1 Tax=Microlunatus kandeliicorticis TaxID=1759536 RepID=A0A7W3P5N8_9ACTN|nr:hypothetical protein [Microlunatus kandeliicorticis]MBA8794055.1 hypothetical protein [Microlunatus kandeliicorticis]